MLQLHAAESGNDVSICAAGGGMQRNSQSVIISRTALCVWEGCCSGRWRQRAGECRAGGSNGGGVEGKIYDGLWSFDRRADFVAFSKFLSEQSASPRIAAEVPAASVLVDTSGETVAGTARAMRREKDWEDSGRGEMRERRPSNVRSGVPC
jgi:hypothetical protein